jgi:hypothetical protein
VPISSTRSAPEKAQRLDHAGHQRWLRGHLPVSDRDRLVEVGAPNRLGRHELSARDASNRLQHPLVANPGGADRVQEFVDSRST